MIVAPPTDRHGSPLTIGQRVRAELPWGTVEGVIVGLRAALDTTPAWVSVMTGVWNEVQAQADKCVGDKL